MTAVASNFSALCQGSTGVAGFIGLFRFIHILTGVRKSACTCKYIVKKMFERYSIC